MSTLTVPREVTPEEVVEVLQKGLDPRYEVLPGMRMPQAPFSTPRPGSPEHITVTGGPMVRAQVTVSRRPGRTDLRITPGGLLGDLLMNTLGIARNVRQALVESPALRAS